MSELIDEIRKNIDFLYDKHNLLVKGIQVSKLVYINMQEQIIENLRNVAVPYVLIKPIKFQDIPVVINEDLNSFDYELVVSIPSYNFRKGSDKE